MAKIWQKEYWANGAWKENLWKTLTRPGYGYSDKINDFYDSLTNGISNWWDQKTDAYSYDSALQNQAYEENLALQQQQQLFDLYSSSTEQQRAVADMKAAGLNVGALGGSGSTAMASGGTGLSTATPSSEAKAKTGTNPQNTNLTNALINKSIIDFVEKHHKEIADTIPKEAMKTATSAKEQMRKYG